MSKMITLCRKMCALKPFPAFQCQFLAVSWGKMLIWAGNGILFYSKSSQTKLPHNWEAHWKNDYIVEEIVCTKAISCLPMLIFGHFLAGNGYLGRKLYLFYPISSLTNLTHNWGGSMSKMNILSRKMCALQTFPAFQCPFLVISWQEMATWAGNDILSIL